MKEIVCTTSSHAMTDGKDEIRETSRFTPVSESGRKPLEGESASPSDKRTYYGFVTLISAAIHPELVKPGTYREETNKSNDTADRSERREARTQRVTGQSGDLNQQLEDQQLAEGIHNNSAVGDRSRMGS